MAKESNDMNKPLRVITFNANQPQDREVVDLCLAYGRLPNNEGIPVKSLIRNLLKRTLKVTLGETQMSQTAGVQS